LKYVIATICAVLILLAAATTEAADVCYAKYRHVAATFKDDISIIMDMEMNKDVAGLEGMIRSGRAFVVPKDARVYREEVSRSSIRFTYNGRTGWYGTLFYSCPGGN
jgi:putative intracellular protease/amidase